MSRPDGPGPGAGVRRLDGLAALPAGLDGSVVTVGMFDGVHRGHRVLLDRVAAEAAGRGVPAAAVTFDRHPLAVLRPGSEPPLLTTLDRKVDLLGQAGMAVVLMLEFTSELSQVGAEDFATQVLFDGLAARAVVVGENFRFGHKAAGDPDLLADLGRPRGIEVVAVGLHQLDDAGREGVLGLQQRHVALGLVAEAEVLPDADVRGLYALDEDVVDEVLGVA